MSIKKAELHVHLEGTLSPALAKKIAARNHLTLPENLITPNGERYQYENFMGFLRAYDEVAGVIRHPQDYYDLTFDYLKSTALGGGIYVEMMYSPDHAEKSSGVPSCEHLKAIQQAIDDAKAKFSIIGRIIITGVRHFGEDAVVKVAKQALREHVPCIVGFGLGGDEFNFPPKRFKEAYEIAHEGGLQCTIHAGEFAGPERMLEALDNLPIKRIGHGVNAIHSEETIARLIDKNILLEICPSSNVALGLFPDLASHPLKKLLDRGVKMCLNSDDPPFFATTLAKEYEKVQVLYGFTDDDMRRFTREAIDAAFVGGEVKKELVKFV